MGKFFSKYELLFKDQVNSSSDPSQILILQFPLCRVFLLPSPPLPHFNQANSNSSSLQSSPCSSLVSLFCFTPFSNTPPQVLIYQTIWRVSPIKFIIKLHTDHNTLWVKHTTHQKAEPLFHFHNPTCGYNHLYNLLQKSVPLLQSTFTLLYPPYFLTKSSI